MKKTLACICCAALVISAAAGNLTALAAETEVTPAGAAVEIQSSGETLDSQGITYDLKKGYDGNNTARVTGFSQKVYAALGNPNYNTDHKLTIPSEVEGNDGTKYTVTEISMEDSIYHISWKDGKDALTFETVIIPKTVKSIGYNSFEEIKSLKYVDIEKGSQLTKIPDSCFESCTNLIRVGVGSTGKLPEGICDLGDCAFCGCESLKSFILPASISYIDDGCFRNCTSLESVVFETYKSGENKGKSDLVKLGYMIVFADGGVFENCTSLKKVVLPNSKGYEIGERCFRNTAIETIEIPNCVTQIGQQAFENTPLKGINLPESCTKVGEYAFANTKLNENGLKTPDGKAYGIAFVCKTVEINKKAFNLTDGEGKPTGEQLKTTIAGYDNSNAHSYAIENDMKFVSLGDWDPCKITYHGDIDDDGQTGQQDVARLTQYVNGWKDIQINVDACDVNGDGAVNLLDVARLKQYVNGWDVPIY